MDTRHHEVISSYLQSTIEKKERPTLQGFVQQEKKYIAQNTRVEENLVDTWTTRFGNVARALGIRIARTKSKIDWGSVALEMLSNHQSHPTKLTAHPAPTLKEPSTPSNSSRSTSSTSSSHSSSTHSSKSSSVLLTDAAKESFKQKYDQLDHDEKWKLPSGATVEDVMFNFGMKCLYEHPAHSFILCLDDPCWSAEFEEGDLQAVFANGNPSLPSIHPNARKFLDDFDIPVDDVDEETIIHRFWTAATTVGFFDPIKHFDEDWLQSTILQLLSYYRWGFIEKLYDQGSEMDLSVYLWSMLDRCFHQLQVDTRRDQLCLATSARVNEGRAVLGIKSVSNKYTSIRPDLVLLKDGVEFGVAECGRKDEAGISKKEIVENQLLCPKTMKDMFVRAAAKAENDESTIRGLRIVGFHQTGFRFHMTVLDCPSGYVCRILASKEYEVPISARLIPSKLLPILELALQAKSIVSSSIKLLEKQRETVAKMPQDFAYKSAPSFKIPQALNIYCKRKADEISK